jgi:thymidylate synthase
MMIYTNFDEAYQDILRHILKDGVRKTNRTGVDTLSVFSPHFKVDISERFPLLTLKNMGGRVWNSAVSEMLWYLKGDHHIQDLKKETGIWNAWADENDNLSFAYGRFWRRFPIPPIREVLEGEAWPYDSRDSMQNFVNEEEGVDLLGNSVVRLTFDQIKYIVHSLKTNPFSRRMSLSPHHPANAAMANPPACHILAVFNVTPDAQGSPSKLNCHLTMRSSDVGLGLPFNVAQYSMLTYILAREANLQAGVFSYTGVDAHLYVADGESNTEFCQKNYAEEILEREPRPSPVLHIKAGLDDLTKSDLVLQDYNPHPHIGMKCVP